LGDAFAAVFATGIPSLAHLRFLNLLVGNDLTSEGNELLDRAWRAARKPPVRMRTVINKDEGPLYFLSRSLLLSLHLACALAPSLAHSTSLQSLTPSPSPLPSSWSPTTARTRAHVL
jgi:hypothetical protein